MTLKELSDWHAKRQAEFDQELAEIDARHEREKRKINRNFWIQIVILIAAFCAWNLLFR